ncbi:MAG: hypothetical protein Q9186_004240 [Xanthomendoza sp. 1 TL-2023]
MVKRPPKKRPPPPTTTTTTTTTTSPPLFQPPTSTALSTLLSTFPTPHIYILTLDPTPPSHRLQLFLPLLLFNTLLIALLAWRITTILPTYLSLFTSTPSTDSPKDLIWVIMQRMSMFFIDGIIFGRYIAEWPWEFFVGRRLGSCFGWRYTLGFFPAEEEREVVVRRSRRWADEASVRSELLLSSSSSSLACDEDVVGVAGTMEQENPQATSINDGNTILSNAIGETHLKSKNALLLTNKHWSLYFRGMLHAHSLLHPPQFNNICADLANGPIICIFKDDDNANADEDDKGQWFINRPREHHHTRLRKKEANDDDGGKKLRAFKDLLTAMGREGLFFRWVEVMQYESHSSSFEQRREKDGEESYRTRVVKASRELFAGQGVSWDEVIDGIGGVDGLFGM